MSTTWSAAPAGNPILEAIVAWRVLVDQLGRRPAQTQVGPGPEVDVAQRAPARSSRPIRVMARS